jgi:glycerate kinase
MTISPAPGVARRRAILIAPGAFKHSLSASQAADAIQRGLARSGLDFEARLCPIADGGNGTLDAFLARGGQRISVTVEGPLGEPVDAAFGWFEGAPDGPTAVIEMALASGLELIPRDRLDAARASTYGTGQLMRAALDMGAARIIVGLGGSATTDGGAGCLQALGARLLDSEGQPLARGGGALGRLAQFDAGALDPRWRAVELLIATDVDHPALGPRGAAAVFGPQKGATPEHVTLLEANLSHFFACVKAQLGRDVRETPGGGAAGALAAGLMAALGGQIRPGVDLILAHHDFEALLDGADLLVTGEGRIDAQTLGGKGPLGAARAAARRGVPSVALVGGLEGDDAPFHDAGVHVVLPIVTGPMTLDEALRHADELLERAALRLGYLLQLDA